MALAHIYLNQCVGYYLLLEPPGDLLGITVVTLINKQKKHLQHLNMHLWTLGRELSQRTWSTALQDKSFNFERQKLWISFKLKNWIQNGKKPTQNNTLYFIITKPYCIQCSNHILGTEFLFQDWFKATEYLTGDQDSSQELHGLYTRRIFIGKFINGK